MAAGALLIASAIGLLAYNQLEDQRAGDKAADLLSQIRQQGAVREPETEDDPSPVALSGGVVPWESEKGDPDAFIMIDGYAAIGILAIPALGLELPVMADWDYPKLRIAPCRYAGSVQTGDLVILAHNYSRHFGRLKSLSGGENVIFTDVEGNADFYAVAEIEVLEPTAVEEMTGSGYPLTLFTCTYGGQKRVVVRCDYRDLMQDGCEE